MKRTVLIVLGLIVLIILGTGVYFFFFRAAQISPGPQAGQQNPLGIPAGTTPIPIASSTNPDTSADNLTIYLTDGSAEHIPDFTKGGQPEWASSKAGFQVAGSEQTGPTGAGYQILYFPEHSYFSIGILAEPIGPNRLAAETELRTKLALPDAQLCRLNIKVYVLGEVSDTYSGYNLGLSFCPGATALPE